MTKKPRKNQKTKFQENVVIINNTRVYLVIIQLKLEPCHCQCALRVNILLSSHGTLHFRVKVKLKIFCIYKSATHTRHWSETRYEFLLVYYPQFVIFRMNLFGIQCCPISVPWNRRLQSLAVALWALLFFLSIPITTFTLYFWMFHSNYLWLLALFYIAWYFYDLDSCNKGGRR